MNFLGKAQYIACFCNNQWKQFAACNSMQCDDVQLTIRESEEGLKISVNAGKTPVEYLRLRWPLQLPPETRFAGDAWERTYGT